LKAKGFNFEATHIAVSERLHNMLAVLSIAFCFSYKLGMIVIKKILSKLKITIG